MITAIYMRVSTEKQHVDLQMQAISSFLQYKGITEYIKYVDEDKSGKNTNRPELKKLLDDCKQGKVSSLIVYKLDRLSRSLQDLLELLGFLNEHNVTFVSVTENLDFTNPFGKACMQMLGVFSEFEREIIRARTKAGMQAIKVNHPDKPMGRQTYIRPSIQYQVVTMRKSGSTYPQIIEKTGVSLKQARNIVKKLGIEKNLDDVFHYIPWRMARPLQY